LAILTPDGQLFASDLCCRIISDGTVNSTKHCSNAGKKRRGVCFEGLTFAQKEQLERFFDLHTEKTIH